MREYATLGHDERIRLIKNLIGLRLALATLGLVAALVFALAAGYRPVLVAGIALWGIGLMLTFVQQAVGVPLLTRLQLGWVSTLELLRQGATLLVVLALVLLGSGLLPFLAAPIPVSILLLAITIPLARGMVPFVPGFDRAEWSRILRMTIAYSVAATVGTIYVAVTVLVMSIVGTKADTGYYGASYRIFTVLGYVPVLLVSSAFPILSRAARDDRIRLGYALQRLLEVALILGVWLALCTALGAGFLIQLIAGPSFEPAVAVLEIQAFALIGTFLAATLSFALLSERLHTGVLVANAIALVAGTTAALGLVPLVGAKGAAAATVVGESILTLAYAVALFRRGGTCGSRREWCRRFSSQLRWRRCSCSFRGSTASRWQWPRVWSTSSSCRCCGGSRRSFGRRCSRSGRLRTRPKEARRGSCRPVTALRLGSICSTSSRGRPARADTGSSCSGH